MKRIFLVLLPFQHSRPAVAMALFLSLTVGNGQCGEMPPGRVPEVRVEVMEVSPVNEARMPNGDRKRFEEGAKLRFRILSPVGGHLSLFLVSSGDDKPQRIHQQCATVGKELIAKNEPFEFPDALATFKIEAAAPFGMEKLVAVVTAEALPENSEIPVGAQLLAQGECRYETYPGRPAALRPALANNGSRTALVLPLYVTFDTRSTAVSGESNLALLRVLADALANPPLARMHLRIEGHADHNGSALANLALSNKRAETVAALLRKYGIATERILVDGRGSYEPAIECDAPEIQRFNRRVELRIVDPDGPREGSFTPESHSR